MSQRDTGQFVTLQSWRSKFKNGSHWPKIKMSAGMQTLLVLGEESLGRSSSAITAFPPPCSVASFPSPALPFFPTYTKHTWIVPDNPPVSVPAD